MFDRTFSNMVVVINILSLWWVLYCSSKHLEWEAGLLTGLVAPILNHGLLDSLGVCSRPGADLLGNVDTLLHLLQVRGTWQMAGKIMSSLTWSWGTSFVTCLHCFCGSMIHSSSGFSLMTVLTTSWHSSGPWVVGYHTNSSWDKDILPLCSRNPSGHRALWAPCDSRSWWCTWSLSAWTASTPAWATSCSSPWSGTPRSPPRTWPRPPSCSSPRRPQPSHTTSQ